jgi:hypothetical protein
LSGIQKHIGAFGQNAAGQNAVAAARKPKPGHLGLVGFGRLAARAPRSICSWPMTQVDRVADAGDEGLFPEDQT